MSLLRYFVQMPENSRIWIYTAERPITIEEHEYLSARLGNFVDSWKAHGTKLQADFALLHKRFIIIAVNEEGQNATGCSVDTCVHELQDISQKLKIDFFNRLLVLYRDADNDMVASATTAEFKQMVAEGDVNNETLIFDTTLKTVCDLRTRFEVPAANAWTRKYLKKSHSA